MSEREQRNLRGPVESLRVEFAELDPLSGDWQPPRHFSITRFDRSGRVAGEEYHNPDGAVPLRRAWRTRQLPGRGERLPHTVRRAPSRSSPQTMNNPIEEDWDERSATLDGSGDGGVRRVEEPPRQRTVRYEYRYDPHGNWIERVGSVREAPSRDFHRSNIERHALTYYDE